MASVTSDNQLQPGNSVLVIRIANVCLRRSDDIFLPTFMQQQLFHASHWTHLQNR